MGIRFSCPACGRSLNVKAELAGKRGRCPHCQGKIVIPSGDGSGESVTAELTDKTAAGEVREPSSSDTAAHLKPEDMPTVVNRAPAGLEARVIQPKAASPTEPAVAVAPRTEIEQKPPSAAPATGENAAPSPVATADAISEAPQLQWYVMPPGAASQYGPAVGEEFRAWIAEGRVTGDSLIWRQDWPEWKRADAVFAQLQGPPTPPAPGTALPLGMAAPPGAIPASIPLPTAAGLPMGQLAPPMAAGPAGIAAPASGFPAIATADVFPAGDRGVSTRRPARPYRPRSNTGPMIVVIALVVAMIPLSYFVFDVVRKQFFSAPPTKAAEKAEAEAAAKAGPATSSDEAEE